MKNSNLIYAIVILLGAMACFLITKELAAVNLEQPLFLGGGGNLTIFTTARDLPIPTRTASQLSDQWDDWIKSVSNPTANDQVSLKTGGVLLQVGFTTTGDDRWYQFVCRYFMGSGLTEQQKLFCVNSQVYTTSSGVFHYWRPAWEIFLPGQNLSVQKWFPESGNTTPRALFIGSMVGEAV